MTSSKMKFFGACLAIIFFTTPAFSEDKKPEASVENHDHNHAPTDKPAEKAAPESETPQMGGMGMGKKKGMGMNMGMMHSMMNECMKNHNDGQMCESKMMEQCDSEKNPGKCKKMMKKMKKQK